MTGNLCVQKNECMHCSTPLYRRALSTLRFGYPRVGPGTNPALIQRDAWVWGQSKVVHRFSAVWSAASLTALFMGQEFISLLAFCCVCVCVYICGIVCMLSSDFKSIFVVSQKQKCLKTTNIEKYIRSLVSCTVTKGEKRKFYAILVS